MPATPRPWSQFQAEDGSCVIKARFRDPEDGRLFTRFIAQMCSKNSEADAKLIVHCVNAHPGLVKALEQTLDLADRSQGEENFVRFEDIIRPALELAEEK